MIPITGHFGKGKTMKVIKRCAVARLGGWGREQRNEETDCRGYVGL